MAILALWVYYGFHPWPFWHYGCIMDSIRGHFGIMGGVHYEFPSMTILALWVVYYGFHPWPYWHYGWRIMNLIGGHFGIMGGVL
jgi:hypothetical protein